MNLHKIGQIKKMFTHLNVLTIWKVTQCLIKSSFVVLFKKSEQHERNKQEYFLSTEANINQDWEEDSSLLYFEPFRKQNVNGTFLLSLTC